MKKSRFQKGSGCFTCHMCGKKTRAVYDNGELGLCSLCKSKCECGNTLSDSGFNGDAWAIFSNCATVAACEQLLTVELAKLEPDIDSAAKYRKELEIGGPRYQ
jgi:hypothetical protein